jgi:putative transposase
VEGLAVVGVKRTAAAWGAWIVFCDESGQSLRPPKGRTWARRGQTPVVAVPGRGTGRVSIAGLLCVKPGERTRLIYRTTVYHGRTHEPKGFGSADFAALLTDAHQQLRGPIMVVWDNLPAHVSAPMRAWIAARADWLLVYRLPPYAPEINPAEGVWANLKGKIYNLAIHGVDALAVLLKSHLKRLQYQPDLLNAFIAETGLSLEPP